jgi:hypothetical protein
MIVRNIALVAALGLAAGACSYKSTTQAVVPGPIGSSEQACIDYGFVPGSGSYTTCVQRERDARLRGRVVRGYAETQLVADARDACYSYGLTPGTARFDGCVNREVDARRWREEAANSPPVGYYAVTTVTYPTPAYVPPAPPPPPAGVQAFRDEYGFRYDGQGNRIDARGNIISPQSTQP